jgi:hypothetical protein
MPSALGSLSDELSPSSGSLRNQAAEGFRSESFGRAALKFASSLQVCRDRGDHPSLQRFAELFPDVTRTP